MTKLCLELGFLSHGITPSIQAIDEWPADWLDEQVNGGWVTEWMGEWMAVDNPWSQLQLHLHLGVGVGVSYC